ncbi:MAG: SpoIIE family protein phosphatase, partial [Rhodospirillales bacterium]|nr:SpoIIE family protein phosphatase [Rhodospirillales bacterium]
MTARRNTALPLEDAVSDRLEVLAAFSRDLTVSRDLEGPLSSLLAGILRAMDAKAAGLFLTADDGTLFCRGSMGTVGGLVPEGDPLFARCLQHGTVECEYRDPRSRGDTALRSLLCAPLTLNGRRLGVLSVANKRIGAFLPSESGLLEAAAGAAALAISNDRLTRALDSQKGVGRELELAAEIQRNLLPHGDPAEFPVVGLNRPARLVSGDFFDFFPLDERRIPFALADVSGKGMNAALLMAKSAGLFRCLAKTYDDPADLLAAINREICETASRGMFVTMVAGIYDHETGALWFANAGHEPPLLRAPDRSYKSFPAEAPPLGILPDLTFETHEIELAGGEFY